MVAVIQAAITAGAALGGVLFDRGGYQATFTLATIFLILSSMFATFTSRVKADQSSPSKSKVER